MLLSCSDKVSNIAISPSSPKNCYKPISKIAPIYLAKTVSSSRRQCKLLGWIMSVSFRGVYQAGSITHGPRCEIGRQQRCSLSTTGGSVVLPSLRTQDGARSRSGTATLEAVTLRQKKPERRRNGLIPYWSAVVLFWCNAGRCGQNQTSWNNLTKKIAFTNIDQSREGND